MLVEGQLAGGFVQGLGGALFEEFVYNEQGQPLSTNFADYLIRVRRGIQEPSEGNSRRRVFAQSHPEYRIASLVAGSGGSAMSNEHAQVLIVGAGPVGLSAAIELGGSAHTASLSSVGYSPRARI